MLICDFLKRNAHAVTYSCEKRRPRYLELISLGRDENIIYWAPTPYQAKLWYSRCYFSLVNSSSAGEHRLHFTEEVEIQKGRHLTMDGSRARRSVRRLPLNIHPPPAALSQGQCPPSCPLEPVCLELRTEGTPCVPRWRRKSHFVTTIESLKEKRGGVFGKS